MLGPEDEWREQQQEVHMGNTTHAADELAEKPKTTKIKIRKQDRASGTHVDVMVNGLHERLAVDQEIVVGEHVVEVLNNSSIEFDVVGGDGGVSSSSTAPLTDTATRAEPNIDPLAAADGDGPHREVPELGEDTPGPGVGGAVAADLEPEARLAAQNAEGQGTGFQSGTPVAGEAKPKTDTATRSDKPKAAAKKPAAKKAAPKK